MQTRASQCYLEGKVEMRIWGRPLNEPQGQLPGQYANREFLRQRNLGSPFGMNKNQQHDADGLEYEKQEELQLR